MMFSCSGGATMFLFEIKALWKSKNSIHTIEVWSMSEASAKEYVRQRFQEEWLESPKIISVKELAVEE